LPVILVKGFLLLLTG